MISIFKRKNKSGVLSIREPSEFWVCIKSNFKKNYSALKKRQLPKSKLINYPLRKKGQCSLALIPFCTQNWNLHGAAEVSDAASIGQIFQIFKNVCYFIIRVAQNFKHEKFIWDQADSYSLRKRMLEKC